MLRYALPSIDPLHTFPGQRADERAIIFARHHWVFDFAQLIQYLTMLLVAPIIYVALLSFGFSLGHIGHSLLIIIYCGYALTISLASFVRWLKDYLDYLVVTSERVVDVDQVGVFRISVSEASLNDIQDVSSTIPGFLGSMFGFGDLRIQTAAEKGSFTLQRIPRPMDKRSRILDLAEHYRSVTQAAGVAQAIRKDVKKADDADAAASPGSGAPPPEATA